jgi:hypothetical protein
MKTQIVEQIELFSEAELESLEFVPEELEAIEAERVPDLDSISFEDIAEDLVAALELSEDEAQRRWMSDPDYTSRNIVLMQVLRELAKLRSDHPNDSRIPELTRRVTQLQREQERIKNYYRTLPQLPPVRTGSPLRAPSRSRSLTRSLSGLGSRRSGGASS